MKNIFKVKAIYRIAWIIALVAVIGFSFVACSDGSTDPNPGPLDGVWYFNPTIRVTFEGNTYKYEEDLPWDVIEKGTFSLDGAKTKITFNYTHMWDGSSLKPDVGSYEETFSISGNTIVIDVDIWTKQP